MQNREAASFTQTQRGILQRNRKLSFDRHQQYSLIFPPDDDFPGAAATLKLYRPRLAVSQYHKPEDYFEIPICLMTHFPFYRLYLDHYTMARDETVLYAIADPVG